MLEVIKIIGPMVALFGVFKILADVFNAKSSRRRENYKLTKEFLSDLEDSNENQFLIQSGFLALTGLLVSVNEIKYLMRRNNPLTIIDLKPTSDRFIGFNEEQNKYQWKKKFGSRSFQKYGRSVFLVSYVMFIIFAMLPHLGGVEVVTINWSWAFLSILFLILAITSLNFEDNFRQAKRFMNLSF